MNKKTVSFNGFSLGYVLGFIVLIVVIIFIGYYVFKNKNNQQISSATHKNNVVKVQWASFTDQKTSLSFRYPTSWKLNKLKANSNASGSNTIYEAYSLVSPNNNELYISNTNVGGKGGATSNCSMAAFSLNDLCVSRKVYSVLKVANPSYNTLSASNFLYHLNPYILEEKYNPGRHTHYYFPMAGYNGVSSSNQYKNLNFQSNTNSYLICYELRDTSSSPAPGVSQYQYLGYPCNYDGTGLSAIYRLQNKASFQSSSAKLAVQIMQSISFKPFTK